MGAGTREQGHFVKVWYASPESNGESLKFWEQRSNWYQDGHPDTELVHVLESPAVGRPTRKWLHLYQGNQGLNQSCDNGDEKIKCNRRPGRGGITRKLTGYEWNEKEKEVKERDLRYPACGEAISQQMSRLIGETVKVRM